MKLNNQEWDGEKKKEYWEYYNWLDSYYCTNNQVFNQIIFKEIII
jgi:hypothetical protein